MSSQDHPQNAHETAAAQEDRAARRARRRGDEDGKRVVWDETNLRENHEWQLANPVTKHITEPDTPYNHDIGSYSDDDDDENAVQTDPQHPLPHHHHRDGDAHHDHPHHQHPHNHVAGAAHAEDGAAKAQSCVHPTAAVAVAVNPDDASSQGAKKKVEDESWHNAEYNHVGSAALRQAPLVFTAVAPASIHTSNLGDGVIHSEPGSATVKRPAGIALETSLLSQDAQVRAEQARHDAEFQVMRKAVYKDEGAKFKAMLAAAAAAKDDEDEDDDG